MRDYDHLIRLIQNRLRHDDDRAGRMRLVADAIWEAFADDGVSWAGFYVAEETAPEDQRLVLGPRRDKPACSPIGLHGVCGGAYRTHRIQLVHDVKQLGPNYVACDPRDQSEIVIPLLEERDPTVCWGALDLDSFDVGAFDESDAAGLVRALTIAGFRCPDETSIRVTPA